MKKKLLAVLMTGIMAASFAGTATSVYAADDDNTLTVWAWDQNFKDRKSTRLNSSHTDSSRMPSSA